MRLVRFLILLSLCLHALRASAEVPPWLVDFASRTDALNPGVLAMESTITINDTDEPRVECSEYRRGPTAYLDLDGCGVVTHPRSSDSGGSRRGVWSDGVELMITDGWLPDDKFSEPFKRDGTPYQNLYGVLAYKDPADNPFIFWYTALRPDTFLDYTDLFGQASLAVAEIGTDRHRVQIADAPKSMENHIGGIWEFDLSQPWPLRRHESASGWVKVFSDPRPVGNGWMAGKSVVSRGGMSTTFVVTKLSAEPLAEDPPKPVYPSGMSVHDARGPGDGTVQIADGRGGARETLSRNRHAVRQNPKPVGDGIDGRSPGRGPWFWVGNIALVAVVIFLFAIRRRTGA